MAWAVPTAGAAEKTLGTHRAWQAYSFPEEGKTVCALWAQPQKSGGDYSRRGPVNLFVSHRSWAKPPREHEISFEAGYTFKEGIEVKATIDGKVFTMFTQGGTAWNRTAADDSRMVQAMRAGETLVVEGMSSRGTETRDTFSLIGFTAAHNAINKACKVAAL